MCRTYTPTHKRVDIDTYTYPGQVSKERGAGIKGRQTERGRERREGGEVYEFRLSTLARRVLWVSGLIKLLNILR